LGVSAVSIDQQPVVPPRAVVAAPIPAAAVARVPKSETTCAMKAPGEREALELALARMDAYKHEARQMRADALRRFSEGLVAGSAVLAAAVARPVAAPLRQVLGFCVNGHARRNGFLALRVWLARWRRARAAAWRARIRHIISRGLAGID